MSKSTPPQITTSIDPVDPLSNKTPITRSLFDLSVTPRNISYKNLGRRNSFTFLNPDVTKTKVMFNLNDTIIPDNLEMTQDIAKIQRRIIWLQKVTRSEVSVCYE